MKPITWLTALRRVTIISMPSSTTDSAKARSSRASASAPAVTRSITTIDSATRPMPSSIVGPTPTTFSIWRWMPSLTMIRCSAVGNDDGLEDERDAGGDVKMRRVLRGGLPGDRRRQHQRMQREDIEQRVEPVLIDQHEADQHQRAGEQMGDVEGQAVHGGYRLPETNSNNVASRPSISAAPRNSGTRNTRILAIAVSNTASSSPKPASFTG